MLVIPPIGLTSKKGTDIVSFVDSVPWFQQSTTGNLAVTLPGGVQVGDLLIAVGFSRSAGSATSVTGPNTGFWSNFSELNSGNTSFQVFWKIAGVSEADYTMVFAGGSFSTHRATTLLVFRDAGPPAVLAAQVVLGDNAVASSWTDPSDESFELVVGAGNDGLNASVGIVGVAPGSFINDELDNPSGALAGLMWSSYRRSTNAGLINYSVDFDQPINEVPWNRIRIPTA